MWELQSGTALDGPAGSWGTTKVHQFIPALWCVKINYCRHIRANSWRKKAIYPSFISLSYNSPFYHSSLHPIPAVMESKQLFAVMYSSHSSYPVIILMPHTLVLFLGVTDLSRSLNSKWPGIYIICCTF